MPNVTVWTDRGADRRLFWVIVSYWRINKTLIGTMDDFRIDSQTRSSFVPVWTPLPCQQALYHLSVLFKKKRPLIGIRGKGGEICDNVFWLLAKKRANHKAKKFYWTLIHWAVVYGAIDRYLGFWNCFDCAKSKWCCTLWRFRKQRFRIYSRLIHCDENGWNQVNTKSGWILLGLRRFKKMQRLFFSPELIEEWLGPMREGRRKEDEPVYRLRCQHSGLLLEKMVHYILIDYYLGWYHPWNQAKSLTRRCSFKPSN